MALSWRFLLPTLSLDGGTRGTLLLGAVAVCTATRFALIAALCAMLSRASRSGAAFVAAVYVGEIAPTLLHHSVAAAHIDLPYVQVAWLGGEALVGAVVAATSVAGAELASRRATAAAAWLSPLVAALAFGAVRTRRPHRPPEDRTLTVAILHTDVRLPASQEARERAFFLSLAAAHEASAAGASLVVMGETALPMVLEEQSLDAQVALVSWPAARVVVGAAIDTPSGRANSALVIDHGRVVYRHDKRGMLPLAEADAPTWLAELLPLPLRPAASVARPSNQAETGGLALSICYETVTPHVTLERCADSSCDLLVSLANDGWFVGPQGARLHAAHARLRSVELGRAMARASNAGESAVVDAQGRVLGRGREGAPFVGQAVLSTTASPAARLRVLWRWLLPLLVLATALWRHALRSRMRAA